MSKYFILLILITFIVPHILHGLPSSQISIELNGNRFNIADSIQLNPQGCIIRYHITGVHSYGSSVITTIRLPQVLTVSQVVEQIVLYYIFLEEETQRNHEQLHIFPFFVERDQKPPIRVKYYNAFLQIDLTEWQTVTRPDAPSPVERDIYNQIVEDFFNEVQDYNALSEDVFMKISQKNSMPIERVKKIYQDVTLWNASR